jgi:hypothetical protein
LEIAEKMRREGRRGWRKVVTVSRERDVEFSPRRESEEN